MIPPNANYEVVSAMLAPALFMTAAGSLLISANNRLARVVDRLRTLTDQSDQILRGMGNFSHPTERLEHVRGMIRLQMKRAKTILNSITLLYSAFACFVGSSLGIAINFLTDHIFPMGPVALDVIGVVCLLGASAGMLREARLGVRALNRDVDFYTGIVIVVDGPIIG